jgi:hypothetical protein
MTKANWHLAHWNRRFLFHLVLGSVAILMSSKNVFGQQLPKLDDLTAKTNITYDPASSIYTFRYRIFNGIISQGAIGSIDIDISTDSTKQTLDTVGLRYANQVIEDFFHRSYPTYKILPVGFPIVPGRFLASATAARTASFFCAPVVQPGTILDSITITSRGLPGLRKYVAEPYIPDSLFVLILPDEEDTSAAALTQKQSDSIRQSLNAHGWTVGPVAPDSPFVSTNFLDTVKSYVNQSRTLGWITSDQAKNKYLRFVDTAKAYLQANIRGVTKARLDSTILSVYPDSVAGLLTSEACALIRFNTEYVLQKLREEDEAFAAENKSSSWNATSSNGARHLVKTGNYLHEIFASGGEIYYRRSADEGATWNQTSRINTAIGENSYPCVATTQHVSIELVWQRRIAPSIYEIWHSYSQDEGASWSAPAILPDAGEVSVSGYQTEGPMPVIAESRHLIAVYCSSHGLRYRVSEDEGATWQVPEDDTINGQFDYRVRFPSLAGGNSYLSLLYDYVNDDEGPYSRIFDGSSWSDEQKVAKGAIGTDGAFSSVAIDGDDNPVAAWSGITNTWTRSIVFRAGYADNKWSNWFVAFGQGQFGPDWVYPSLTYYKRVEGQDAIAIVNHTSSDYVYLNRYVDNGPLEAPYWETSTLSESGAWANISQENASSGRPFHCLTDQSSFPYEVVTESSSELSMRGTGKANSISGVTQKRRAVVYHPTLRSTLTVEFEPLKIVAPNGDTSIVRFKASPKLLSRERDSISFSNMWEYLGSGVVSVPANARRLVLTKQFTTRGPSIAKRKFFLRVLNANGVTIGLLDSAANSGTISVNIAQFAGMNVILRPQVTLVDIDPPSVTISVGDVFNLLGGQSQPSLERKTKPR